MQTKYRLLSCASTGKMVSRYTHARLFSIVCFSSVCFSCGRLVHVCLVLCDAIIYASQRFVSQRCRRHVVRVGPGPAARFWRRKPYSPRRVQPSTETAVPGVPTHRPICCWQKSSTVRTVGDKKEAPLSRNSTYKIGGTWLCGHEGNGNQTTLVTSPIYRGRLQTTPWYLARN